MKQQQQTKKAEELRENYRVFDTRVRVVFAVDDGPAVTWTEYENELVEELYDLTVGTGTFVDHVELLEFREVR